MIILSISIPVFSVLIVHQVLWTETYPRMRLAKGRVLGSLPVYPRSTTLPDYHNKGAFKA